MSDSESAHALHLDQNSIHCHRRQIFPICCHFQHPFHPRSSCLFHSQRLRHQRPDLHPSQWQLYGTSFHVGSRGIHRHHSFSRSWISIWESWKAHSKFTDTLLLEGAWDDEVTIPCGHQQGLVSIYFFWLFLRLIQHKARRVFIRRCSGYWYAPSLTRARLFRLTAKTSLRLSAVDFSKVCGDREPNCLYESRAYGCFRKVTSRSWCPMRTTVRGLLLWVL